MKRTDDYKRREDAIVRIMDRQAWREEMRRRGESTAEIPPELQPDEAEHEVMAEFVQACRMRLFTARKL